MDSKYPDLYDIQIYHDYMLFMGPKQVKHHIKCNFELVEGTNVLISSVASVSVRTCTIHMSHQPNRHFDHTLLHFDFCTKMTKAIKKKQSNATIITINVENGEISNKNGPAIVARNSNNEIVAEAYCLNGYLHRTDGPALKSINTTIYAQDGIIHLDDGPAFVNATAKLYFKNGILHRENKPAIEYNDESFLYFNNGLYHRPCKEGPAVYLKHDYKILECFLENNLYHNNYGPAYIFMTPSYTRKLWMINGLLHNEEGPADVTNDRHAGRITELYLQYGFLHRTNGPAVISGNTQRYYYRGLLHRTDGPAIISPLYSKYYFYGHLHRDDGPAIVSATMLRWSILGNPSYNHGYNVVRVAKHRRNGVNRYCLIISDTEEPNKRGDILSEHLNKQEAMNQLAELQNEDKESNFAIPKLYNCKLWANGEKNM